MKKERLVAAPHTFMLSVLLMISIPAAYAIMLIPIKNPSEHSCEFQVRCK